MPNFSIIETIEDCLILPKRYILAKAQSAGGFLESQF
jgi:hypothetical protein